MDKIHKNNNKLNGHWIRVRLQLPLSDASRIAYKCSNCNLTYDCPTDYCCNCGTDMRESEEQYNEK